MQRVVLVCAYVARPGRGPAAMMATGGRTPERFAFRGIAFRPRLHTGAAPHAAVIGLRALA